MLDYLRRLFLYHDWANREVLQALTSLPSPPSHSIQVLAHILSAERLWYERLSSQPQSLPVWPDFGLEKCEALLAELSQTWEHYLRQLTEEGLAQTIQYKNSKGEPWESRVEDVLTHVVLHAGYHRGQVAAEIRASGNVPPYTDFIHAVRQSLVE